MFFRETHVSRTVPFVCISCHLLAISTKLREQFRFDLKVSRATNLIAPDGSYLHQAQTDDDGDGRLDSSRITGADACTGGCERGCSRSRVADPGVPLRRERSPARG